jgi:hypothetical protein
MYCTYMPRRNCRLIDLPIWIDLLIVSADTIDQYLESNRYNRPIQKSDLKMDRYNRPIQKSDLEMDRSNSPIQKSDLETDRYNRPIQKSDLETDRYNRPIQKSEHKIYRLCWPMQSEDRIGIGRSNNRTFRPPLSASIIISKGLILYNYKTAEWVQFAEQWENKHIQYVENILCQHILNLTDKDVFSICNIS